MKRFLNTLRWDIQLQFRNGFYYVSAFVAILTVVLLKQIPGDVNWSLWWPPVILENLVVNSFYFFAGLVLLEKREGTLEAQIVTPLRTHEYLFSKVLSLGLLSLLETIIIILAVSGPWFNWIWMVVGILLLITMYALYGFIIVSRYDSINEFILPSALWVIWFSIPLLYYFDIWKHWLIYIHPLQAPLIMMQAAFDPLPAWKMIYGILYSLAWIGLAYFFSQRAFYKFVIRKEGTRI